MYLCHSNEGGSVMCEVVEGEIVCGFHNIWASFREVSKTVMMKTVLAVLFCCS